MNKIIQANHGFTVKEENGRTIFVYHQERYTTKTLIIAFLPCAFVSFLLLAAIHPSSVGSGFFFWLIFTIGLFRLVIYFANMKRTEQSFAIDRQGFHVNGNSFLKEHITGLYIQALRSPQSTSINMQSTGTFIPVSGNASSLLAASSLNAVNAVGQIGEAFAAAQRNKMIAINYRIFLRYGNKNTILAKGITADTADVMFKKIVEVSDSYNK